MSQSSEQPESKGNDRGKTEVARSSPPLCPFSPESRRYQSITGELYQALEEAGCPLAQPAQDRLRFETLLANLSATFVNVVANEVDSQIELALRQIVEHLDLDRSGLGELSDEGLVITHSYQMPGVPPSPRVLLEAQFPFYARKIHEGEIFRLPDDLPPEATRERDFCTRTGLKSNLTIPLKVMGCVVGGIGFASFRSLREWPDDLVQRLRLIGDIFTNALARKRADEALRLATQQAINLRNQLAHATRLELVSQLTTSIAHEVNQPLCAIASNAQTAIDLLSMGDTEEAKKALGDIWGDARRASEVINRIRGLIRKDEPSRTSASLVAVIEELAPLLHREAIAKGVDLHFDLNVRDITVVCDRVQLQQVILNLLLNAAEAVSEASVGRPGIVIRAWGEDFQWACVSFQDTGVGLSAEECERVFTPFFTTKAKGLGMGLSLSRSLIEAHGGKLWATPGIGCGTVFHIRLPVANGARP